MIKHVYMRKIPMNQYLLNKSEKVVLNHYDDPKTFIKYSNDMQIVYRIISKYNLGKKPKVLIVC